MTSTDFPYAVPLYPAPPALPPASQHSVQVEELEEEHSEPLEAKQQDEQQERQDLLQTLKHLENENFFFFEVLVVSVELLKEEVRGSEEEEQVPGLKVNVRFDALPDAVISQEDFETAEELPPLLTGRVVYEETERFGASSTEASSSRCQQEERESEKSLRNRSQQEERESAKSLRNSAVVEEVVPNAVNVETEEPKAANIPQWNKKCGISCLFPMTPMDLIKSFQRSCVEVNVYRYMNAELDTAIVIGSTEFRLEEQFCRCVLQAAELEVASTLPKSAIKQDVYTLRNDSHEEVGKISLRTRLACFGSAIITRCERKESVHTYIFKNSPVIETFKCQQHNLLSARGSKLQCQCKDRTEGFICPEAPQTVCSCACACPEEEGAQQRGKSHRKYDCPFQVNCPFQK